MIVLPIYDLTPFTMQDFPDHTACIIWMSGCNMRCSYCHNPQIIHAGAGNMPIKDIYRFLEKRQDLLDGVVLSGGEATLYRDLYPMAKKIKKMGYKIKLDTNGSRPEIIQALLKDKLVDYIALDYKAPKDKFLDVTKTKIFKNFSETLSMLCGQKTVPFEVRTTVHTDLMDEYDVNDIIKDLAEHGYQGTYYIQNYCDANDRNILDDLPPQTHILDPSLIEQNVGFQISYRNF